MILDEIIKTKREEIEELAREVPRWERLLPQLPPSRDFRQALQRTPAIIAEVKQTSPSRGRLLGNFNPVEIARDYRQGGAAAISVLTEKHFFDGDLSHLMAIRKEVDLPLLRKDFILEREQILESRVMGADAILLIVAILDGGRLEEFITYSRALGLAALVEVHREEELARALAAGAEIIGINNRDLRTFQTDITTSARLAPLIPPQVTAVSESGIKRAAEIRTLLKAGIKAFLIGETLITAADRPGLLAELRG